MRRFCSITTLAATSGSIRIAGRVLRYRIDRRRPWTHLHYHHADLGRRTGQRIGDGRPDVSAAEVIVPTPWGDLRAVLWDLGPGLDIVVGREALGGPSPSPRRPLFPFDGPEILMDVADGSGALALALQRGGAIEKLAGKVLHFPVRRD